MIGAKAHATMTLLYQIYEWLPRKPTARAEPQYCVAIWSIADFRMFESVRSVLIPTAWPPPELISSTIFL